MENIGIYCILFFSLLAIHGVFADPTLCNAADTDLCTTCCIGTDPAAECITDILKCPLNPNTDFSVLVTILIIICAFIIGKLLQIKLGLWKAAKKIIEYLNDY